MKPEVILTGYNTSNTSRWIVVDVAGKTWAGAC